MAKWVDAATQAPRRSPRRSTTLGEAMLEFQQRQEEKARRLKRHHSLASVDSTVLTSGKGTASSHD